MLKRIGIALILAVSLAAATTEAQDRVDLVVLLDSSQSMFQYYNQVVDFVLSQTVKEYMRFGDAFHLVSFSDTTQVEIAQVLRTEKDIRSAVARLYLLYPLGRNTDLVMALRNVYQY
ncbi:MAG TPA: VWA domain-containing protein, partial [Spirochaetales bacterium]|nr:VWA domain-containing protein [Spirochaetales bacterium]